MFIEKIPFHQIEDVWMQPDMWGDSLQSKGILTAAICHCVYYWDGNEHQGGWDVNIRENNSDNSRVYYGCFDGDELLGVNSYYRVNDQQCRSRGLYVYPHARGRGVGQMLLKYAIDQNRDKGYEFIWSMPRKNAKHIYESVGFEITSDDFTDMPDGTGGTYFENAYCKYDY